MTTPERWREVKEMVQAALDRAPTERAAFLADACAGDPELKGDVESLLAYEGKSSTLVGSPDFKMFLREPADLEELAAPTMGKRIGAYRIVRKLGHGGMGSVYLAERADEHYRENVALKIVKRGMNTDFVLARFRHERQILALLNHPNIARLLGGGSTDEGLPYFVMEYIEGEHIDRYCKRSRLAIPERLKLFQSVCGAVHHAHQSLIIHRDIKPANIIVAADGTPKLLDFGIAKILNPDIADGDAATATGVRLMTPEYASPEQVRGQRITTASDIYSLGVVLYELLTGQRPYRLDGLGHREIENMICEAEPPRPSSVRRDLAGDLDNIVLMAMRKEPGRRYASVEHLAEDLHRHLAALPVTARESSVGYRVGKFVVRHKLGVAATALLALSLVGGLATTIWQAGRAHTAQARAERRFNDLRKLAHSYLFDLHDAIANLQGSTPARALIAQRALEYLDELAREASGDASLLAELAAAYQKVGDVQGNPFGANVGDTDGALASYAKSLAICEQLVKQHPTSTEARGYEARSHEKIGDVLRWKGDTAGALRSYRRSLELRQHLATDAGTRRELAGSWQKIGDILQEKGDWNQALAQQREALAIREELAPAGDEALGRELAVSHERVGETMQWAGDKLVALEHFHRARILLEELASKSPNDAVSRNSLAIVYRRIGDITGNPQFPNLGKTDEAPDWYRKSLALFREIHESDPKNAQAARSLASIQLLLGDLLDAQNDATGARQSVAQALAIYRTLSASDPANAELRRDTGLAYGRMGVALQRAGEYAAALESYADGLAIFTKLASENAEGMKFHRDVGACDSYIAETHVAMAEKAAGAAERRVHYRAARDWAQKSLDVFLDMARRGKLSKYDEQAPDELRALVARCDTALRE